MRSRRILLLIFLVVIVVMIVLLAGQRRDLASMQLGSNIVFANTPFTFTGERDSLVVIASDTITLQKGSQINDDVALIALSGAPIVVDGHILGDLTVMGGDVFLGQTSVIEGETSLVGAQLTVKGHIGGALTLSGSGVTLDSSAQLNGPIEVCGVQSDAVDDLRESPTGFASCKTFADQGSPLSQWIFAGVAGISFAGLAALSVALFPHQISQMEDVIRRRPRGMFGLGLATLALAAGLSGILMIALASGPLLGIILTPLYLILIAVLGATGLAGTVTLALMVGDWVVRRLGWQSPPMVMAMIGGVMLALPLLLFALFPTAGLLAAAVAMLLCALGLGAALHTRLGTRQTRRRFFVQG
ncbi:MAG: hypothetical protein KJ065_00900 [Anaerolineae bacterium]|nr:hypothetical protein [Anaerolineae bacterium]